jgi:hypothetical protein
VPIAEQQLLRLRIKITTKEVSHIINKFQKTFDSYWQSDDFELFDDSIHKEKLIASLSEGKTSKIIDQLFLIGLRH